MARQTDLTKGNILHTLMQYAVPFIVSNVLQATYNITDMIIAGQYGGSSYAQSAIGNCTTVTSMLTQVIIGLATGGSILIGQYYGARREKEQRESTVTLFTMCLIIGVVVSLVLYLAANQIMVWMNAPALEQAQQYLRICALGMFFITCYNGACAALRAVGDSKIPFLCVGISVAINIVLDLVFMAGLDMGVAGAAWATVIAPGDQCGAVGVLCMAEPAAVWTSVPRLGDAARSGPGNAENGNSVRDSDERGQYRLDCGGNPCQFL